MPSPAPIMRNEYKSPNWWFALAILFSGVAASCPSSAPGQDVSLYEIVREEFFAQATTNRPSMVNAVGHLVAIYVVPASAGSVLSASVSGPGSGMLSLTDSGSYFYLASGQGPVLFSPAHAGAYHFIVTGASQGSLSHTVSLPGTANGIPPVRVSNYLEAEAVDASAPFDVQWEKVVRRGKYDVLELSIYGPDGQSVFSQSSMSLTDTNLTIAAGTFQPDTTYHCYLTLVHYFGSLKPSAPPRSLAIERRITRFNIKTLNPAGVFKISPLSVVANENAGEATMTVLRTQGSDGDASVDYFATDGTAVSKANYAPVFGTLIFPSGVSNQTFTVPLMNDGVSSPPLTAHFTLTNATSGASLITRPHGILTILDADSAPGPSVNSMLIAKEEFYAQTNAAAPTQFPLAVSSRFYASVGPAFPGGVIEATLKLPDGATRSLGRIFENYQAFYDYTQDFPSPASLNKSFRSGKYQLSVATLTDGVFTRAITLGTERVFAAPHVTNWAEAQTIDPSMPFTLAWVPIAHATANDYVRVIVTDDRGEYVVYTPNELMPGALPGSTASYTIPADALDYDRRYFVNVIFSRTIRAATKEQAAIPAVSAFIHTTELYTHTIPSTNTQVQVDRVYVSSVVNDIVESYSLGGSGSVFANSGLNNPVGIAYGNGFIYVANYNDNSIEKFDSGGNATLFANTGLNQPLGLAFDTSGNLYAANFGDNTITKFDGSGNATLFANAGLSGPYGLAFDSAGFLYAANGQGNSIVRFDPSGSVSTFANSGLSSPAGLAFDKNGYLYVANAGFNNILKFDSNGNGTVFANSGMNAPVGLAFDSAGYLYAVNQFGSNSIIKFDSSGNWTLFANSSGLSQPFMIVIVPGH